VVFISATSFNHKEPSSGYNTLTTHKRVKYNCIILMLLMEFSFITVFWNRCYWFWYVRWSVSLQNVYQTLL